MRKKSFVSLIILLSGVLFFSSGVFADERGYEQFCETNTNCQSLSILEYDAVDAVLSRYRQQLSSKPIALVATQVDRLIRATEKKLLQDTNDLKNTYLLFRLQGWRDEVSRTMTTISLPVFLLREIKRKAENDEVFLHELRGAIMRRLLVSGYTGFITKPYGTGVGLALDTGGKLLGSPIPASDDLDLRLARWYANNRVDGAFSGHLYLMPEDIAQFGSLYLFKNVDDLEVLGYTVVSSRTRINRDASYRRHNIATAFHEIGPVRIVLPGETISFLRDAQYDPGEKVRYQFGKVIAMDEEVVDYGGGLCGAVTAIYQGTVTNRGFSQQMKHHSKRFTNLYTAVIDGQQYRMPGLDATVYNPGLDYTITNTKPYPIVLVMNYDGQLHSEESVFTLGKAEDKGSVSYLGGRSKVFTIKAGTGTAEVTGGCYTWLINDDSVYRCYKEVK